MTTMERTRLDRLREHVREVLTPAKKSYEELTKEIEEKLSELSELRSQRDEIRRLIRSLEPDFEREPRKNGGAPNKRGKTRSGAEKYSPERVAEVNDWLRANADQLNQGEGFFASEIVDLPGCPVKYQSGLSAILVALHEQGLVRLTKKGGQGGRKYFKVVI